MSDFDKEAEREKLRKKFADDDEKRADTRRMSELLLKGATMTNKHCNQCSDPLFRYDGQTFCPSCQAERNTAQSEPQAETEAVETEAAETQSTATERQPQANSENQPQATPETQPASTASETAGGNRISDSARSTESPAAATPETASPLNEQQKKTQSTVESTERRTAPAGSLTEARQSLTRTVTRFAREAEQTDDPRRARELLTAAREAAATLAELA